VKIIFLNRLRERYLNRLGKDYCFPFEINKKGRAIIILPFSPRG
jgi:hypothetical protein